MALAIICYAPSREFDYQIMKFDLISVIFRLYGLSTVFRNFLKNYYCCSQIFLVYMLFLKRLAAESKIKALESKEKTLHAHHINSVVRVSQTKYLTLIFHIKNNIIYEIQNLILFL